MRSLCLFPVFLFALAYGQLGDWRSQFESCKADTSCFAVLDNLANYYSIRNTDSCIFFASNGLDLAERYERPLWKGAFYYQLAVAMHNGPRDFDSAVLYCHKGLTSLDSAKESKRKNVLLSDIYNWMGNGFKRLEKPDSAVFYLNHFERILLQSDMKERLWEVSRAKASFYYDYGEYELATQYAEDAYTGATKIPNIDRSQLGYVLFFGANASLRSGNVALYEKNVDRISALYHDEDKPLNLDDEAPMHSSMLVFVSDIDVTHTIREAMLNSTRDSNLLTAATHGSNLILAYVKMGKIDKAIPILEETVILYERLNMPNKVWLCKTRLYEFYKKEGDVSKALLRLEEANVLRDSVQKVKNLAKMAELELSFETEKKTKEITQKTVQRNLWIGSSVVLGLAGIVIFFLLQNRLKLARKLSEQQQREAEQKLGIAHYEAMVTGQEHERKRIAQELHDSVGGTLASIKAYIEAIFQNPDKQEEFYLKSKSLIDNTSQEVRRISQDLMPLSLERLGLKASISDLVSQLQDHDISCELEYVGDDATLSNKQNILIFRIIQELCNNIRKHAHATEVLIQVIIGVRFIDLVVEDNGVGFDVDQNHRHDSRGLQGVIARASMLGCTPEIDSRKGTGTSVTLSAPVKI
ncbi:MAG: sensor histidine kinase [Bacteroidia bacterium]